MLLESGRLKEFDSPRSGGVVDAWADSHGSRIAMWQMNTNKPRQNILVQWLQWFKIQGKLQHNSCPRADLVGMSPSDLGQLPVLLCWILYLFVSYVIHYIQIYTLTLPQQNCTSSWIPDLHAKNESLMKMRDLRYLTRMEPRRHPFFLVLRVQWFHRNLISNEGSSFSRLVESFLPMFLQGGDGCVEWSKMQKNATVFMHSFHDINKSLRFLLVWFRDTLSHS